MAAVFLGLAAFLMRRPLGRSGRAAAPVAPPAPLPADPLIPDRLPESLKALDDESVAAGEFGAEDSGSWVSPTESVLGDPDTDPAAPPRAPGGGDQRRDPAPPSIPMPHLAKADVVGGDDDEFDPVAPRIVRFVVVRGSQKGRQFRCVMKRALTVGSRSTCDLVIPGEDNLDPEQFAVVQDGDTVFIESRSDNRPTLVNGLPIESNQILRSGDLIGNGDVILRFVPGG